MKCPYCGFDNSFYGTESKIVCANCGTTYDVTEFRQLSQKEIGLISDAINKVDRCDITLLFPKIMRAIDKGITSFFVKKEYVYGDEEFKRLKDILPDDYGLEIIKRVKQKDDVFIEIVRDRRKPIKEKEMYHIFSKI